MKKNVRKSLSVLAICLFSGLSAYAQPSVNSLNFTNLGTKILGYPITGTVIDQAAGANLTWNYGTLTYSPAAFYLWDVPSTSQPQAVLDAFPSASYFTETNGMDNTNYVTTISEVNSNGQFILGNAQGGTPTVLGTPDPFIALPLTYQSVFGDRTYDAYGTLTTPFGTFNNVIRIKHDSGGARINYLFYTFSPVITVLMGYDVDKGTLAIVTPYFYNFEQTASITSFEENKFEIYPNPAKNSVTIQSVTAFTSDIEVFSVTGEKVLTQLVENINSKEISIDISKLTTGIYYIKAGAQSQKLVVE